MTYITNFERYNIQRGKEEGLAEGKQEGTATLVLRQLKRRLGKSGLR